MTVGTISVFVNKRSGMALYDNKHWLLSHIRNSFISTDDTGMCEVVMAGEKVLKDLADKLDALPASESSDDDDDLEHESYEIPLDMNFGLHRQRSNTAARLEKMDQARKKASKIKMVKWETNKQPLSEDALDDLFTRKPVCKHPVPVKKSMLSEQLEKYTNMPQNPYMEFAKYDGTAQVGVTTRKYKIFLTMLPEEHRNYPIDICCVATAKVQDLIGLICLKGSNMHGEYIKQPANYYGLYITEENGEVEHDLPCLDPKECVAKYGFTCLGLVEHKNPNKNVSFDVPSWPMFNESLDEQHTNPSDESKQKIENMMAGHKTAMEAPLYKSYKVYILNKMRGKVEIHLGISGEKIEIDPVQQKTSKFTLVRQKAVSHNMDSVAWCEIMDNKNAKSSFRVVYCLSFNNLNSSDHLQIQTSPTLQTSASFKHYDFEAEQEVAEEVVQKINLILKLRSSVSRKEYLAAKERKLYRRKSFTSK